jgi:hypothetical protein
VIVDVLNDNKVLKKRKTEKTLTSNEEFVCYDDAAGERTQQSEATLIFYYLLVMLMLKTKVQ